MSNKTFTLPDDLYDYLLSVSLREDRLLQRLRHETEQDSMSRMQIAPEQGQFMALLIRVMRARRALEIGVYTGYSSLCVAMALPRDGALVALDSSDEWTQVARRYWREAGVDDKVDLRLGDALASMDRLVREGLEGQFDFAFIDADKREYQKYFERALRLVRAGGLIAIDNTLWYGRVADPKDHSEDTLAIRAFNEWLHRDSRVDVSLIPIGDGLTLAHIRDAGR